MNGNLALNVLFDSFPNPEAAAASLFPYLDRAPNAAIHITTGARKEQGRAFALQLKAKYPSMDVILRILPDENPGNHQRYTPDAFVTAFAPWAAGGLILSLNNEAGVGDLAAQNTWYTAVIEKFGKLGIRCATPSTQTHNSFDSAAFDSTYRMLAKYNGLFTLHYYWSEGAPISPLLEPVTAYCKARGIALKTGVTELGYAQDLAPQAGYHGRLSSADYARRLVDVGKHWPDVLFFIYAWGAQSPWEDFDISQDKVIQDALVKHNQEQVPVTPPPVIQIPPPTVGGVLAKLTKVPPSAQGYVNIRSQPVVSSEDIGNAYLGDQVIYYPEAKSDGWVYIERTPKWKGWVSLQAGAVQFTPNTSIPDANRVVIADMPYTNEFNWRAGWTALCGETSLYMCLLYDRQQIQVRLPPEITPYTIALYLGKGAKDFTNLAELEKAADAYGLAVRVASYSTAGLDGLLKDFEEYRDPIICLLDYSKLPTRWDQKFSGGHLLCVVGYSDQSIITHDPDALNEAGKYVEYPRADFAAAWSAMGNTALVLG